MYLFSSVVPFYRAHDNQSPFRHFKEILSRQRTNGYEGRSLRNPPAATTAQKVLGKEVPHDHSPDITIEKIFCIHVSLSIVWERKSNGWVTRGQPQRENEVSMVAGRDWWGAKDQARNEREPWENGKRMGLQEKWERDSMGGHSSYLVSQYVI